MEGRFRSLYFAMLATFILFGIGLAVVGATLPRIIDEFRWSYVATGAVLAAGSVGYFVSTFVSGMLVRRLGPKLLIVIGLSLQAIGLAFFGALPLVTANMLLYFMVGVGHGSAEVVVNWCVVRMERAGRSRLMNLMHAAFAAGAVIGPLGAGRIMAVGSSWQTVYRLMAAAAVVMAGAMALLPFSRVAEGQAPSDARPALTGVGGAGAKSEDEPGTGALLRHPLLILCFLTLFLYVGAAIGVSSWVAEYYVEVLGASAATGAYMVSVYWAGLLAGRLAASFGFRGRRQAELLLVMACACTVALALAVTARGPWLAGVGFFASGLAYSAIYPVVISIVGERFRRSQGVAIGFVATGGGMGAFAFPFLMSAIADRYGLQRGFLLYVGANVLMVVLTLAILRLVRAGREREPESAAEAAAAPEHTPRTKVRFLAADRTVPGAGRPRAPDGDGGRTG